MNVKTVGFFFNFQNKALAGLLPTFMYSWENYRLPQKTRQKVKGKLKLNRKVEVSYKVFPFFINYTKLHYSNYSYNCLQQFSKKGFTSQIQQKM